MTEEIEDIKSEDKMLQIFYLSGQQLVIIDSAEVMERIFRFYNSIPPGTDAKITDYSPKSIRHYVIGTQHVVNMILEDTPNIDDDDDNDEEETEPEPEDGWNLGDLNDGNQ